MQTADLQPSRVGLIESQYSHHMQMTSKAQRERERERAEVRLNSMTSKGREKERSRLTARQALRDPIQDDEITHTLSGEVVPTLTPQSGHGQNGTKNAPNEGQDQNDPDHAMEQGKDVAPDQNGTNRNQR